MTHVNDPFPPNNDEPFPEGAPETVTIVYFNTWETGVGETRDHLFRATWPNGEWRELFYLPAAWVDHLPTD